MRPSVLCSSGCSLPALGLHVQRCHHRPLLPLARQPVRSQRSYTPHCLPSIFRYIQAAALIPRHCRRLQSLPPGHPVANNALQNLDELLIKSGNANAYVIAWLMIGP